MSDSVETSPPHRTGQPILAGSSLSFLPTLSKRQQSPGYSSLPGGSVARRFQMTGLLCSTQFSGGKAGRSLGGRVWSEGSILCGAGVDTEQWPLQGSGEEVTHCALASRSHHSSQQADGLESLLYFCSLLRRKTSLGHFTKTRPLFPLAAQDTGRRANCSQPLVAGRECS